MLPDLPELKSDFQTVLTRYLQEQVRRRMPGLNEAPQHVIHEGMRTRVVRADGTIEDRNLKKASAEIVIEASAASAMTAQERTTRLDAIAEDMARQISQYAFASLNATLEQAGQVVDRGGQRLDAEAILEVLEKMHLEFDDQGKLQNLSLIVGPQVVDRVKREFERFESEPLLKERYDALMQRKWVDWRDREAARKLVG